MKSRLKKAIVVGMLACGCGIGSAYASGTAYVDVQKVVASSVEVKQLKQEQIAKGKEFMTALDKARKDIASVTDTKKKQSLEEKYSKEFESKKAKIDEEYSKKLLAIENSISNVIAQKAKEKGYDMVVAKSVVLYGGEDMTEDIIKVVSVDKKKQPQKKAKPAKKN